VVTFLGEEGLPPGWLAIPQGTIAEDDPHAILAAVWRAGSEGRRIVWRFMGHWIDDQLLSGPDAERGLRSSSSSLVRAGGSANLIRCSSRLSRSAASR
jgi:hypothetical protein